MKRISRHFARPIMIGAFFFALMAAPTALRGHEEHPEPPAGGGGGFNPPPCNEFVTGGGWIIGPSGAKANFGIKGATKDGAVGGHLNYLDHGNRLHVKSQEAVAYLVTGPNSRLIEFKVNVAGADTARVFVTDNGEPGRDDVFEIQLLSGGNIVYQAGGQLGGGVHGGGNIQLHKPKCD